MRHKLLKHIKTCIDEIIVYKDAITEAQVNEYLRRTVERIEGAPYHVWYAFWYYIDDSSTRYHHTTDEFSEGIRHILTETLGISRCECIYRAHESRMAKRLSKREPCREKVYGYKITTKITGHEDKESGD